jgi:hypothetical protein
MQPRRHRARDGAFSQRETVGCEHRSGPRLGQPFAGELERRVAAAQPVEIVAILIAAGDGEDASKTRNADFRKVRRSSGIGDSDPGGIRFVCDG